MGKQPFINVEAVIYGKDYGQFPSPNISLHDSEKLPFYCKKG